MSKTKNLFLDLFFTFVSAACVYFFNSNSYILTFLLLFITIIYVFYFKLVKNSEVYLWFVVPFFLGPFFESICIFGGAWEYKVKNILVVPAYLPFLWGLAGVIGSRFVEKLNLLVQKTTN